MSIPNITPANLTPTPPPAPNPSTEQSSMLGSRRNPFIRTNLSICVTPPIDEEKDPHTRNTFRRAFTPEPFPRDPDILLEGTTASLSSRSTQSPSQCSFSITPSYSASSIQTPSPRTDDREAAWTQLALQGRIDLLNREDTIQLIKSVRILNWLWVQRNVSPEERENVWVKIHSEDTYGNNKELARRVYNSIHEDRKIESFLNHLIRFNDLRELIPLKFLNGDEIYFGDSLALYKFKNGDRHVFWYVLNQLEQKGFGAMMQDRFFSPLKAIQKIKGGSALFKINTGFAVIKKGGQVIRMSHNPLEPMPQESIDKLLHL